MKLSIKLILTSVFVLNLNLVFAQKTKLKREIAFVNWFFKNPETRPYITLNSEDNLIVYSSGLSHSRIDFIKKELSQDTLIDLECKKNKVALSSNERAYINKELEKMKFQTWPKKIFKNSILINSDTISAIFKKPLIAQFDFFSKYSNGYSFFSRPIFIRNNTLCIFYCGYNCSNLCFDDQLFILRKEGEGWVEFISLIDTVV